MVKVCFWGILISSFSLALVSAIMHGFEQATHKKLQGIHADLIMNAQGKALKYSKLQTVIQKEFSQEVHAVTPQTTAPAMIRTEDSSELPTLISLISIDPSTEGSVTILPTLIQRPTGQELPALLKNNSILIGQELAEQLGATVGDTLDLYTASEEESTRKALALESHTVTIGGIFKTGIDEFDAHAAYCAHDFFTTLFPEQGITTILIKTAANTNEKELIHKLKKRLHLSVYSWKDLYPALVSALVLEKYAMFFILALISLIATMNIISLLFMYITQKTGEIVLLKTLGIQHKTITTTFMIIGISIACAAACLGLLLAIGASWLLEQYPFITLPDAYYVSHLPAEMTPAIIFSVFGVVMLLSLCATWIPVRRIRAISVPDVLKREL